jgi:hypothetical protein
MIPCPQCRNSARDILIAPLYGWCAANEYLDYRNRFALSCMEENDRMENAQSETSIEPTTQDQTRSIDVTGLPEEAVQALESLVSALRSQQPPRQGRIGSFASYEEWSKALREWVQSHPKRDALADDSRESIYAGRGE